jgi:hypothetical protein
MAVENGAHFAEPATNQGTLTIINFGFDHIYSPRAHD